MSRENFNADRCCVKMNGGDCEIDSKKGNRGGNKSANASGDGSGSGSGNENVHTGR